MYHERTAERVRFTCWHCGHSWMTEYEVTHVDDGHGHECDYYSLDGLPALTPTTPGGTTCPQCGAHRLTVRPGS